ncbi:hypothetical protein TWF481_004004 [Arthrobotrys musiformis]|uniref:Major facilitator superfamily (MFS) profile domain-containing protein n=1 Tax=Arthrobotrys musiformis TaxID=47236 RepID=A0AAV9WI93_9PEZI
MSTTIEEELAVSKVYSKTDHKQSEPNGPSGESTLQTGSTSTKAPEFKMDWRMFLAFASLMIITLAAALDATIISVAL